MEEIIVLFFFLFRYVAILYLSGSSFEDIVFQNGMMKSGCIKGVLSWSDYNHAWIVHNVMFKALQRLLLTRFLTEVSGVNVFAARNAITRYVSPMIKGAEFRNQKPK